jgi:protein TonB
MKRRFSIPRPLVFIGLSVGLHALVLAPAVIDTIPVPQAPGEPAEPAVIELLPEEVIGQTLEATAAGERGEAKAREPAPAATTASVADEPEPEAASQGADTQLTLHLPALAADPPAAASAPPGAISISLTGTDSASNALVIGPNVIPASPDDSKRNRPPLYPPEAARRGQTGTVVVLIHITPMGLTGRADVVRSSGVASLDRSAVDAVMGWRFRPAVRAGRAIPSEMAMEFVFTAGEN